MQEIQLTRPKQRPAQHERVLRLRNSPVGHSNFRFQIDWFVHPFLIICHFLRAGFVLVTQSEEYIEGYSGLIMNICVVCFIPSFSHNIIILVLSYLNIFKGL